MLSWTPPWQSFTRRAGRFFLPTLLALVAELQIESGAIEKALGSLQRASDHADRSGADLWDTEVLRLRGLALHALGRTGEADACFSRSLELAKRRQLPWFELRAATSHARVWHADGRSKAAHDLLAPVYGSFTDGFDCRDLRDAAGLLAGLE